MENARIAEIGTHGAEAAASPAALPTAFATGRWTPPARWRLWQDAPDGGARNMALDLAMLRTAAESGAPSPGLMRLYGWSEPTISFGRNELTHDRFDARSVRAAGLHAVRRPTGGRTLLHEAEITYAIAMPLDRSVAWRVPYHAINAMLAAALQSLGVPVRQAEAPGTPLRPDGPVCFAAPDEGELVIEARKLVGSAVWRERGGYLQHGSILLADRQWRLQSAASSPLGLAAPAAGLSEALPAQSWQAVVDALLHALPHALHAVMPCDEIVTAPEAQSSLRADAAAIEDRFTDDAWTWRR